MLLTRIFEGEVKPNNIAKAKKVNINFLTTLKKNAEQDYQENISKNWETVEDFYAGDQWKNMTVQRSRQTFNALGETVYDFRNTYSIEKNDQENKPKRVVNVTKSQIESLVAVFAEVDPKPIPIPTNDYEYNQDHIKKLTILLNTIFEDENDFNSQYKVDVEGALVYGHYFVEVCIDNDKSSTQVPVKFKYLNPKDVMVDPEAVTLDEADYVIQTVKVKYYQLTSIYDYKHEPEYGKDEPKDMDLCEIERYWIRFKDNKKIKWLLIPVYNNKWLKYKTDDKDSVLVFDDLPIVIFRGKVRERWYGSSIVAELIPSQVEYNKTISEQDWNWMKYVQPPLQGTIDASKVKQADKPGGYLLIKANEQVQTMGNTVLIPQGEFATREQSIKNDMSEVVGNTDLSSGRRPTGVYSNKMLETLTKAAQLKPKMFEEELLKAVSTLAYKALRLLANWIGGSTLYLFDPETGGDVDITADDINSGLYEIRIETKDANLLSKEAKFEIIRDMMQYAKIQETMHPYFLARMVNSTLAGLYPTEVIDMLKEDWEEMKNQAVGTPVNGVPSPEPQGGTPGLPPQQELPPSNIPAPPVNEVPEMTDDEFYGQVGAIQEQMLQSGVPQDRVEQMMKMAVDDELAQGTSKEEILMILEELANKSANITTQGA